ncbi:MAG: formyl-CoA transferase [Dehalococcoidales bacterium]|nr:formyl-CoA transferase [Dehalococcoidales bacterium]
MAERALKGVTVLDISEGIAGPYCARLLGNFGADVIKVEKPGEGDKTRKVGPFPKDIPHPEKSALFLHLNINKKGVTLNLDAATGRKIFKELLPSADILIESFQPGQLSAWGLDYAILEKINPRLLMTSITPFGQNGPYRDYKPSSAVLDALGGHTFIQGDPKREPLRNHEGVAEYTGGMFATIATMGALFYSGDTGQGQQIDISSLQCAAVLESSRSSRWTHLHNIQQRTNGRFGGWPGKAYRCRDGYVALAGVGPGGDLTAMFSVIDIVELLDEKYETEDGRAASAAELDAIIQPWLLEHDKYEIFNALQKVRVQAGVCSDAEDLLTDAGYEARDFWVELDHPEVGKLKYPGPLVLMSETEWQSSRAPLLGEHNEEIYCGKLGYSPLELTQLRQGGVI